MKNLVIGDEFETNEIAGRKRWRVTDVGLRTIIAICLTDHADELDWHTGPPYAVCEHTFDEFAQKGIILT